MYLLPIVNILPTYDIRNLFYIYLANPRSASLILDLSSIIDICVSFILEDILVSYRNL